MKRQRHTHGLPVRLAAGFAVCAGLGAGAHACAQEPVQYVALADVDGTGEPFPRTIAAPAPVAAAPVTVPLPDAPSALLAGAPAGLKDVSSGDVPALPNSLQAEREHVGAQDLSLDQAVAASLKGNLNIRLSTQQEKFVTGEIYTVGNALLPNLQFKAYSNAQEIDLAAMGFKQATLNSINIPGFNPAGFSTIVKVDVTAAQLSLSQTLFNVPAYFLFRAAQKAAEASHEVTQQARGQVVQGVGGLYLRAVADTSEANYAAALLKQDQVVFEHARAARDAGTGINLDVLRAQTDVLNEQQRLAQAQNAVAKDKIQINRTMGAAAGQELNLTDSVPFAELAEQPLEEQLAIAYRNRHDLKGLEAQFAVAGQTVRAVKYERVPTLNVGGFYGIVGVTQGSYHGNFVVQFQASVPIFLEGTLRGQHEAAAAQVRALDRQIQNTRALIESDVRASRLDLESSRQLVKVARSNVQLAQQALDDSVERFTSGVDDNLPVAQAQAALVNAQTQVVQAEFQYNYAKLTLARRLGVAETDYRTYLGR